MKHFRPRQFVLMEVAVTVSLRRCRSFVAALAVLAVGCAGNTGNAPTPTGADVASFLKNVNDSLLRLGVAGSQAGWVGQNFITEDTQALDARATQELIDAVARYAKESTKFDHVAVSPAERRQLDVLKLSLVMATPSDPREAEELTKLNSKLRAAYGTGKWCPEGAEGCLNIDD